MPAPSPEALKLAKGLHVATLMVWTSKDAMYAEMAGAIDAHVAEAVAAEREAAEIKGVTRYAWWRDGVQYVGTLSKTLEDAIAAIRARKETPDAPR